ncbi:hypothetical protein [Bradyrhizobium mercantei]|uniref:hypothetical protein n=1 Tax=Bradyrhizobium mercantei TaxID=1904807 RepID=UPI00142DB75A|nr:hypothetical protein [Bradyrhizobium mercantei]
MTAIVRIEAPALDFIVTPASATTARAKRADNSRSVKPGDVPLPNVAIQTIAAQFFQRVHVWPSLNAIRHD